MYSQEYQSTGIVNLLGSGLNSFEKKHAPETIYYRGAMPIPIRHARVAVIGTREPTESGVSNAKKVVRAMVSEGVIIVSGLAKGIDTAAHRTAMDEGGETVAVIGTPLDKTYPRQNADLQKEIMDKHLVISQYPVGHTTTRKDFVLRNRTMALISDASVIVEAGDGSGTLHQGWEALRLGRPLFICQSVLYNKDLKWPGEMLDCGAIELVEPEHVLDAIPPNTRQSELLQHMS